jgi:hypothetical protein
MNSRSVAVFAIAVACLSFVQSGAAQSQERYKVRLATVPMDGGMRDAVAGSGTATVVLAGSKVTINGTFAGLRSPATAARLHNGLTRGVRGPAVSDLMVSKAVSGTVSGTVDLTPDQVKSLQAGRMYVQVSSEKAPDGNLWGWILR